MDKIKKYQEIVKASIMKYVDMMVFKEPIEKQVIFDEERGHYLLMKVGWRNNKPVYGTTFHIDIKPDGKVWVQRDNTDVIIVDDLLEGGILQKDILLAFHSPFMRAYTGFAVI